MGRMSVSRIEKQFYGRECQAYIKHTTPPVYYVVTNPERFLADLLQLFDAKKEVAKNRPGGNTSILDKRIREIASSLKRDKSDRVRIEKVGMNSQRGLVELLEIPLTAQELLARTPFEHQTTHIGIFVVSYEGQQKERWEETPTGTDLEYLSQKWTAGEFGNPPLTRLERLFVEAIDGTDLTAADRLIRKKEANLSLRRLREATEYAIVTWTKTQLALQGKEFEEPGERTYTRQAKELGFISRSDFAQANAFLRIGSAAVHSDFLAYHKLDAILFTHWLRDFINRTIGHHRMPKSRENGTAFSAEYEYTTESKEYRLRRAIFDQLQSERRKEASTFRQRDVVYLLEREYSKEDVMKSALTILRRLQGIVKLEKGDQAIMEVASFWGKESNGEKEFTAQDATRAAMFAYSIFFESKDIDRERLERGIPLDDLDPNLTLAIRKKGMTERRYYRYNFKSLEPELRKELSMVLDTSRAHFPEYLTPLPPDSEFNEAKEDYSI